MPIISGGYILQPRCFDESEAAHMPPVTRELWFYLLRNVNHKDTGKFNRGEGFFSLSDIQNALSWMVGYRREVYSKPQLTKALRRLRESNMVETTKATRGVFISICNYVKYQNPKIYEGNNEGTTKEQRRNSGGLTKDKNVKNERSLKDNVVENPKQNIPFSEVISFFNEKTGKSFKSTTSSTRSLITARWNDGFRVEDFKKVIEAKSNDWMGDKKMLKYLRPETVFGNKFEGYLNSSPATDEWGDPV